MLNTDTVKRNNNDHVLSFDGKMLGLSSSGGKYNSVVYTVASTGGVPKQITPVGPSYLHGWSPDKKFLIILRNAVMAIMISIGYLSSGGQEIRLTNAEGLDDGPEYSPDGKYIYFNSVRSGTMQIWRMNSDGTNQVELTSDELIIGSRIFHPTVNGWFS